MIGQSRLHLTSGSQKSDGMAPIPKTETLLRQTLLSGTDDKDGLYLEGIVSRTTPILFVVDGRVVTSGIGI